MRDWIGGTRNMAGDSLPIHTHQATPSSRTELHVWHMRSS